MPAHLGKVVGAGAAQIHGFGVVVVIYPYPIPALVHIILYPKGYMVKQGAMVYSVYIAGSMYFFAPAKYFITCIVVNVLNKM
jgi:hypothetical protein